MIDMAEPFYKRAEFPIVRHVVESGHEYVRTLQRYDKVPCWQCGQIIRLDYPTVYLDEQGLEVVRCRNCGRRVDAFHYLDKVLSDKDIREIRKKARKRRTYV